MYEHISRNNLKQLFEAAKIDEIGDVNMFITSVFEEVLGKFWPQPKSQFHCRICNYKEFTTSHLKEEHITSIKHKVIVLFVAETTIPGFRILGL